MPPASPSSRQTLSYLRNLFEERGIRPKNKLGQNFLIDLNLLDLLLRTADLTRDDLALEVGSGTGSLTIKLAECAGAVLSVEIDPAFASLTEEAVASHFTRFPLPAAWEERITLFHGDALKNKNELNPEVLAALGELGRRAGTTRVKLVANLPYSVAVPIITNLLLSEVPVERMAVTVQSEIAERLLASPGTKDFGALAVLVQSLAEVELVRRLPPAVFWPRPKVDSAIVLVRPDAARREHVRSAVGDPLRLRNFLRDLYAHRRKNLRGALVALPGGRFDKVAVDARLAELGIDGTTRAEALDREEHLRLCAVFG
jgi:16S rRNA (adenine1518-N6/adenine1519-N6)-dimethyltransferase